MNSSFENAEKGLKRWLKREAKITMATVVAFLITGAVSYGAEIWDFTGKAESGKEASFGNKEAGKNDLGTIEIGNGKEGFVNRTDNTVGTIKNTVNGTLNITKGGKGFVSEDGGRLFFHSDITVNVGEGGIGFYTSTAGGKGIYASDNTIKNGLVLSAADMTINGGTGFHADGGSIQIGNGGGNRAVTTVNGGTGAKIEKNSYVSFEADSDTIVNSGFGIFLNGTKSTNANSPDAIIKSGATFTVNNSGIGVNLLAGATNGVVTNESENFIVNGDKAVGFQVDGSAGKYLIINNKAKTSKITVENGTGVKVTGGGYAYYYGQGTIGEMVVEKGGTGFYTNAESEHGATTSDNGIKESIYMPGGKITVDGGIGFKAEGTGAMAIGNANANAGPHNTYIEVKNEGTGIELSGTSKAVLAYDGTLTVNNGTGVELKGNSNFINKSTASNRGIVVTGTTNSVGIKTSEKGISLVTGNGVITVNNGTGIFNNTAEALTVIKDNGVINVNDGFGIATRNGGRIFAHSGTTVNVNGGIGYMTMTEKDETKAEKYDGNTIEHGIELSAGTVNVNKGIGFKAVESGALQLGNQKGAELKITVNGEEGIGVDLAGQGTAALEYDGKLIVNNGTGVNLTGTGVFTNNSTRADRGIIVTGANAVGITGTGTVDGAGTVTASNQGRGIFAGAGDNITYNSGTIKVTDNGIGAEINTGKLTLGKDATISVNGANAVGVKLTGNNNGNFTNHGKIDVTNGIGILASGEGTRGYYTDGSSTGTIVVSGENSVGTKVADGVTFEYNGYGENKNGVFVSEKGTGFYVNESGKIFLRGAYVTVNNATGLKADGTGILEIGNAQGTGTLSGTAAVYVKDNGIGVSLSDAAKVVIKSDGIIDVNGENAIGITGTGTVNNEDSGVGKIKVTNGKGLFADAGNTINYNRGTIDLTTANGYGVFADKGGTIHFGNNKFGENVIDKPAESTFDTFLNVADNGTGIKIGENATVTVNKDVEFNLGTGSKIAELAGGTFENNTDITVEDGRIGIVGGNGTITGTGTLTAGNKGTAVSVDGGKIVNNGNIAIADGGTGFIGTGDIINNGTLIFNDTDDTDGSKSNIGTGVKITSNGSIQIMDETRTELNDQEFNELLTQITGGKNDELLAIKGLIRNDKGNVIYVAGKDIVGEKVEPNVTVDDINKEFENEDVLKTDEETGTPSPTDPTGTGTVTITGEDGEELIDKHINVGGNLTITGPTGPNVGTGLVVKDFGVNMYDKDPEKPNPNEELTFTGKVTVDNTDSDKLINVDNDKLVIGTGTGKTDVTFIGGQITGEEGNNGGIVITGDDDTLTLDKVDVGINIGPDPTTGTGVGKLVIGTGVTTTGINVGKVTVTGTGNQTGGITTDDLDLDTKDPNVGVGITIGGNLHITGPTDPDDKATGLVIDKGQQVIVTGTEDGNGGNVTVDEGGIDVDGGKLIATGDITSGGEGIQDEDIIKDIIEDLGTSGVTGLPGNDFKVGIHVGPGGFISTGGNLTAGTDPNYTDIVIDGGTVDIGGETKGDDLFISGGGKLTSGKVFVDDTILADGTVDVSGEDGEFNTTGITVKEDKYGEVFGGKINVGKGGIYVEKDGNLILDGDTTITGTKDNGDMKITVEEGGKFTNTGDFIGDGNLNIDSGHYIFGEDGEESKTSIGGNITVDNGTLTFNGKNTISIGTDGKGGEIKVGTDTDGGKGLVSFAPESKFANDSGEIKFTTDKGGQINIGLADGDDMNSILGNPGANTTLNFENVEVGSVKLNTNKLTQDKIIDLNITAPGENPYIVGFDQNDVGSLESQKDAVYQIKVDGDKIYITYNNGLLDEYGEEIGNIGDAFEVINDKVSEAVDKMVGPDATDAEKKEARAKLANSIYTGNIYSETVKMSYDNLKMSEDAILSLKHRTAKGELAGEGKALHSKTEYTRNGILGNTSSDSEITGLLGAVEYGLTDDTRVGGVFSGSIQDLDAENGTADGKAFYIGGYVNKHTSSYELTAGAGYQLNKFETDNTYLGNTGTEKYDSHALSAYVHGRKFVDLGDGLSFQPKAKLSYSYIEQDDVRDNLMSTEDAEIGIFEAEAGFDVVKSIYTDKAKVDVVFGTSYARAMGDTDKEFTGSFHAEDGRTSSSFDVMGAEIGENRIKFNLGAEVSYENGLFYNGGFNYSFGSGDAESYGVNIGVGYKF